MEKTKRNWLPAGLLAMLMVIGIVLSFGIISPKTQGENVHADLANLAGSELQVKTLKFNGNQSDCTVTFADGRYLHLNPDTNVTVVNNISDGADMEYYNGVLKFYINDNDDFSEYRSNKMSVYALNSTDKQLTVAVDYNIYFNTSIFIKKCISIWIC